MQQKKILENTNSKVFQKKDVLQFFQVFDKLRFKGSYFRWWSSSTKIILASIYYLIKTDCFGWSIKLGKDTASLIEIDTANGSTIWWGLLP